jgi:hypothetical protein
MPWLGASIGMFVGGRHLNASLGKALRTGQFIAVAGNSLHRRPPLCHQVLAMAAVFGVEGFAIYLAVTNKAIGDTDCNNCYNRRVPCQTDCRHARGPACSLLWVIPMPRVGEHLTAAPAACTPPCRLAGVAKYCTAADDSCSSLSVGYCTLGRLVNGSAALLGGFGGSIAALTSGYCPGVNLQLALDRA